VEKLLVTAAEKDWGVRRSVAHFYGSGIISQSIAPPGRIYPSYATIE
jgi:hypothetical protein